MGGAGEASTDDGTGGFGVGGRLQANFTVTAGQVLTVTVGTPGGEVTAGVGGTGFNAGGNKGSGDGGSGGGSSAVTQGSTVLIVAGGGGGAGDTLDGGNGGVALFAGPTDAGSGQNGGGTLPPTGSAGAGGAAQGTPGDGTNGTGNGGGGGAGANQGLGSTFGASDANAGGGGGGNFTTSTAGLTDPGSLSGLDGQVIITTADPGVGCPATLAPPTSAAAIVVTPSFTG